MTDLKPRERSHVKNAIITKCSGCRKRADGQDLKKAYRRVAMKYHPTGTGRADADRKFKGGHRAYEVLSDGPKNAPPTTASATPATPICGGGLRRRQLQRYLRRCLRRHFRRRSRSRRPAARFRPALHLGYSWRTRSKVHGQNPVPSLEAPVKKVCDGSGAKPGSTRRPAPPAAAVRCACSRASSGAADLPHLPRAAARPYPPCPPAGPGAGWEKRTLSVKGAAGVDNRRPHPGCPAGRGRARAGHPATCSMPDVGRQHRFSSAMAEPLLHRADHLRGRRPGRRVGSATLDGRVKLKIPPETQTGKLFRLRARA